ncbi:ADAM 17-like protease [Mizuhopecten yessoensis]|uniref:ADAM 17-like protease n=1 Tax=Mizuhopecten yessoensis TaxID=6573 RepID=A0A210QA07_MIZYE|nr:ADAM 17-like protease [Mizuhopecten yessoensis]OWF45574.1 ADAM 17-like protease [Mizuhopecten yessoensis]
MSAVYRPYKMVWDIISLCVLLTVVLHGTQADLRDHVTEYEVLESVTVHSVKRRSTEDGTYRRPSKHVNFYAVGRNFSLQLKESLGIFSSNFKFQIVDEEGHMTEDKDLDKFNFYHGWVDGEDKSEVTAYFDGDAMTASIFLPRDELVIEPKWRHDGSKRKKGDNSMIVYRPKHMIMPKTEDQEQKGASFCGAVHADGAPDNELDQDLLHRLQDKELNKHHRSKRAAKTRCRLMAVADYRFYTNIGGSNKYTTANYIVAVINRANAIYERTNFGGTGYGFELEQLRLHEGYSPSDGFPYNVATPSWADMSGLLSTFSQSTTFRDYCLVHLFTHQGLNNIYGMGYIAGTSLAAAGGICSLSSTNGGTTYTYNTAVTTTSDASGNTILSRMSELVTAHELGHNWGSQHDQSGDCTPSSLIGDGKYLMYSYAVTGEDPNNDDFSTCSRTYISRVLAAKAGSCFQEATTSNLCGNGRIDVNEECDGGLLGKLGLDSCCSNECTLSTGSVCTPTNYPCCTTSCQMAATANNLVCAGAGAGTCLKETFCDGTSFTCPTPAPLADGTDCVDQGSCRNGVCLAYCEYRGMISCVCNDVSNSCRRCCRTSGVCSVANSTLFLAQDRPCTYGYCDSAGTCIKTEAGLADRFFDLIDKISIDYLVEAFRTNMVAFVQVFSLLVWVPLSCLCWCRDNRRRKKRENREDLSVRLDRKLIYDLDGEPVIVKKPTSRAHRNMRNMIPVPPIGGIRTLSARAPSEVSNSSRRRNQIAPLPLKENKRRARKREAQQ